ncbi:hypothetical protein FS837_003080 [Tulasnella sp. UAMH 9824]|nr:hypothetical protein FS837_003080 [Tulasnella sp. UAMH 9824]
MSIRTDSSFPKPPVEPKASPTLMANYETPTGPSGRASSYPPLLHGWNTTCLIAKLPLELISYIIALGLPETSSSEERMKVLYSTRMVSRSWRNAIDSTPSLWNVISSNLPLRVNSTIVQRSGCCSLDVYITARASVSGNRAKRSGFTKLAELAAKEIGRWSTASLRLPFPDACSSHLSSPAPLLRSLCVTSRSPSNPATPVALFGGIAPRLEVLEVNGVQMDWTSPFIRGLRELDLSDMNDGEISTQQVLEILAITPLLEKLFISNSILDHRLLPLEIPWIRLPNMKIINLSDINEQPLGIILSSIRTPNCNSLMARGWEEDGVSPDSFPEPAFTHFTDFLRRTLSTNNNSELRFFDDGLEWNSRSASPHGPDFVLSIRYGSTTIGVEWATRVIGLGAQELVHDLELTISRSELAENEFAAYHSISRWQSVTNLTVEYGDPPPRPLLDLFGRCEDSEDGIGPIPAFPRLETLVLDSSRASWLDDLEVLVNHRFDGRGDVIGDQVSSLDVVLEMWGFRPNRARVDLAQLQRLRAANGIRSITRVSGEHIPGMLAVVYDDSMGL